MKKIALMTLLVFTVSCGSNKGTSTGNPLVTLSMASSGTVATLAKSFYEKLFSIFVPQSVAMPPPSSMLDSAGNTVVISNFWISLGDIEFKYSEAVEAGEVDGTDVEFKGPYAIDMLSTAPSTVASGNLLSADFRRIKYKLKQVTSLPGTAPAGLQNNAIYISGTVNGKPFAFSTTSEIEMSVAGANLVGAQTNDSLLLQIKLANLVKKINFSAITSNTLTAINESNRISMGSAACPLVDASMTEVYSCIMGGLSSEANLGKDVNGDGELETTEPSVK